MIKTLILLYFRATSGIDYNVKIWTPSEEESVYDEKQASDVGSDVVWIWSPANPYPSCR